MDPMDRDRRAGKGSDVDPVIPATAGFSHQRTLT